MKHAVVTGATGFVGTHLVDELISRGVEVTALCRGGSANLSRIHRDARVVYGFDALPPADVCYHLAWEGASGELRVDERVQVSNAMLTFETLRKAH